MACKILAFHTFRKFDNTNMDNVQTTERMQLKRDVFALCKIETHILPIYAKSRKQFQV
jgi:hypothetical protein